MHVRRTVSNTGTLGFGFVQRSPVSVMSSHSRQSSIKSLNGPDCKECAKIIHKRHGDTRKPKFCDRRKLSKYTLRHSVTNAELLFHIDQCKDEEGPGMPCRYQKKSTELRCDRRKLTFHAMSEIPTLLILNSNRFEVQITALSRTTDPRQ